MNPTYRNHHVGDGNVILLIRASKKNSDQIRGFPSNIMGAGGLSSKRPRSGTVGATLQVDRDDRVMASTARTIEPSAFALLDCLLVDDDPLIRLCVETMVRTAGHRVTSAGDGAEAVRIMSTHRFDVVISDIRMPHLDGWELFQHIRQSSPDTDVILMTAYPTAPDAARALSRGACEYLPKPLDADELALHLQRICERRAEKAPP